MSNIAMYALLNAEAGGYSPQTKDASYICPNDERLIHKAWYGWSNASGDKPCDKTFKKFGLGDKFDNCMQIHNNCASDANCQEWVARYDKAVSEGYAKDFATFKKQSSILGYIEQGFGILGGLFSKKQPTTGGYTTGSEGQKKNTGKVIAIVGGVILIGVTTFLLIRRARQNG